MLSGAGYPNSSKIMYYEFNINLDSHVHKWHTGGPRNTRLMGTENGRKNDTLYTTYKV